MEPWDGPASIVFSDGDVVGAVLDRNGLRPSRYYVTADEQLILSSEVGVLDIPPEQHRAEVPAPARQDAAGGYPAGPHHRGRGAEEPPTPPGSPTASGWTTTWFICRDLSIPNHRVEMSSKEQRARLQKAFGYTYEDVRNTILPMARTGAEPTAAMGIDIPLAVLDQEGQPLFNYFKQLFAQVTNPPIDAIREEVVTDTTVYIGDDGNLLQEKAENCKVLQVRNPILTSTDLMKIRHMKKPGFHVETVSILYYKNTPLKRALDHCLWRWIGPTATGPTSSSSPTGEWTRTMCPSRPCWRCPPSSSI